MINAKYMKKGLWEKLEVKNNSSWLWRSWVVVEEVFKAGLRKKIGDGRSTRIWNEPWLLFPSQSRLTGNYFEHHNIEWVYQLFDESGTRWNANLIRNIFVEQDATAILSIPLQNLHQPDKLIWHLNPKGEFTVKSAYKKSLRLVLLSLNRPKSSSCNIQLKRMWQVTWSLKIKHKLKYFMWRVLHNAMPTARNLWLRKSQPHHNCGLFWEASESMEHILYSCERASLVWKLAPVSWDGCSSAESDFKGWWCRICEGRTTAIYIKRQQLTVYLLWWLWKGRNLWIFERRWLSAKEIVDGAVQEWSEFFDVS
ncbi:ribonuclease H-like superfamily protein [Striga asiatica]|uniref:Ribonuclease H-like superfamily protein n=1 Tax=Striga asiatica TaxID=4170 RepID=A0A5A7P6R6_STRAF|nr:ribonuclease H-like superfamily protein [Striga asiatica]